MAGLPGLFLDYFEEGQVRFETLSLQVELCYGLLPRLGVHHIPIGTWFLKRHYMASWPMGRVVSRMFVLFTKQFASVLFKALRVNYTYRQVFSDVELYQSSLHVL